MAQTETKLTHTSALVLQVIHSGLMYGYTIMDATGLPSGTVYPALRRLEREGLIRSEWEKSAMAQSEQRPPRKYYRLTPDGRKALAASQKRYPLLVRLVPARQSGL
jgi:DNA-binding PadR family transcriptional regulator